MPQGFIRQALSGDAEIITALTDAAYANYVPLLGCKPEPMTVDYQQLLAEHPIWLLWHDQRPIGVLVLMHEPDTLLIASVAIHPQYQGQGFGRQLLAWAEHEARRAGYDRLRLYTNALMTKNIALYSRLGFRETHREAYPDATVVHLAKSITEPADHNRKLSRAEAAPLDGLVFEPGQADDGAAGGAAVKE
ncbi:MAG TPA: GNAT family N-acetyltransferase [Roseiflexaceae bacterium]|nr:GNAT family N-acetyltransferase [Roseiflexaceae bacterium]